ncbi:Uncharacterised protein [Vibrio cholerae]|nr:Uncharacterised protein [Vibrio cholerae]CSB41755.1 Uncharacterised protein [Vibrio cholerae]CSC50990.1 Uncharacterised protein [Vibrio cholerae]CSC76257.1 Uncharacterised protein [Vibrio cholerae]CSC90527.1 Uncharacterised protein [Vibrio cholerae]
MGRRRGRHLLTKYMGKVHATLFENSALTHDSRTATTTQFLTRFTLPRIFNKLRLAICGFQLLANLIL